MSESVIALVSAVFGGAGLKAMEVWLTRGKTKDDTAAALRKELREEVQGLRNELNNVEKELDEWKQKYYDLLDQFVKVKNEVSKSTGTKR